jgi:hypothetical protein
MRLIWVELLESFVCRGCIPIIVLRVFFGYYGYSHIVITRPVRYVN